MISRVFISILFVFFGIILNKKCLGIYDPSKDIPKPEYSSGIKVHVLYPIYHQNYSRVLVHNNQNTILNNKKNVTKLFPVYNNNKSGINKEIIEQNSNLSHIKAESYKNYDNIIGSDTINNRVVYKRKIERNKQIEVYHKCPSAKTGQFVYDLSCNQFLNCWNGRGSIQTCPAGTLFNPKNLQCDFPEKVECITGPRENTLLSSQKSFESLKIDQATCPQDFSGLIPNYTDCTKFIRCNNGQQNSLDCPPGTLFDFTQNICDFPEKSSCFSSQNSNYMVGNQHSNVYNVHTQATYGQSANLQGPQTVTNCDQNIQNCGYVYSSSYPQNVATNVHSSNTQGSNYQNNNCNPNMQNCGSSYNYQETIRSYPQATTTYVQSHNLQGPQNTATHISGKKTYSNGCNPSIENCGQSVATNVHTSSSHYPNGCDPNIQNCGSYNYQETVRSYPQATTTYVQSHNSQGPQNTATHISDQRTYSNGCNPLIQNCGQNVATNVHTTSSQYPNGCDPNIQNCGSYHYQETVRSYPQATTTYVQSHNSQGPLNTATHISDQKTCNPFLQNCGQNVATNVHTVNSQSPQHSNACNLQNCENSYNYVGNSNYPQTTTTHVQSYNIHDPQNIGTHSFGYNTINSGCNPSNQNCGHNNIETNIHTEGPQYQNSNSYNYFGSVNYPKSTTTHVQSHNTQNPQMTATKIHTSYSQDPQYQSGNSYGYIQRPQSSTTYNSGCNPALQHCGQNTATTIHTVNSQSPQYSNNCDPRTQNCGTSYIYKQSIGAGSSYPQISTTNVHSSNCDPKVTQNCICDPDTLICYVRAHVGYDNQQNNQHSHNVDDDDHSYSTSGQNTIVGYNQQTIDKNYNKICNIGDSSCQQSTPKCPQDYNGITKHPNDCTKFLNCANGITYIQDCAPGTLFNHKTNICDFPSNVDCNVNVDSTVEATTTNVFIVHSERNQHYSADEGNSFRRTTSTVPTIYDDVDSFDPKAFVASTTQKSSWPPKFPSTDVNADYIFEYEDGERVEVQPENKYYEKNSNSKRSCLKNDFKCSSNDCISSLLVCDGNKDCLNNKDEQNCDEYMNKFLQYRDSKLDVLEKQRFDNVSLETCSYLCSINTKFVCKSFNYIKKGKVCFLIDTNIGLSGGFKKHYYSSYFEMKSYTLDCSDMHKCPNHKCLNSEQICDGFNDCGDRSDEKGCIASDFGYTIKLAGSQKKHEGRIEVTAFGKTGYICDDEFSMQSANIACKELGFPLGALEIKTNSYFAKDIIENNTLYMMDDIECLGNETSLLDCDFAGWGVHNCRDHEIVGVVCKTPQEKCPSDMWKCSSTNECIPYDFLCDNVYDCNDNSDEHSNVCDSPIELKLVNGSSKNQGRVEIKYHDTWGTICDDDFNEDAAKVICKKLGYSGKAIVMKDSYFGEGTGPIWLDQVYCFGNETNLDQCTHWSWGDHNCDHSEDVGVICTVSDSDYERHAKDMGNNMVKSVEQENDENIEETSQSCGLRDDDIFSQNDDVHFRVVRGSKAKKGDYPWQAALRVKSKENSAHWCGAIIISSRWVLTAAHCLIGYNKGAYVVVAGEYDVDETENTEQYSYIEEYYIHDQFRKGGNKMNNDIALILLKGNGFKLNKFVRAICLPDESTDYNQQLNCTISGFGSVKHGKSAYSHTLMAAWIPLQKEEICKMPHVYGDMITDGMFCAGFLDGGVDACDGDSGGPLACLHNGLFTLYGITSWGHHCGYANKPGVYVKVSHYKNWIDKVIKDKISK